MFSRWIIRGELCRGDLCAVYVQRVPRKIQFLADDFLMIVVITCSYEYMVEHLVYLTVGSSVQFVEQKLFVLLNIKFFSESYFNKWSLKIIIFYL
jgi:hypothetical protein